ncbi:MULTISPECIES: cobalamin B12-binding domain-containing protein [Streptomyces]|uniref:cobalamin B12-binding domain-containing protein n=1 Tax=Streptomyces TaxID=1883 RepID=UPI0029CF7EB2|nr:cobalamin B12-binding domain-containing protein [Streptomyces sp. F8]MDX6761064.1 cobalamin B12-binding domain-containing protein [Streptomyces sp. F8]
MEQHAVEQHGKAEPTGLDVVVTTMASDSHTWNLVFLQLLLEELGHRVTNLGACVPDELLVAECRRIEPDLIVLSSVNGHGFNDGLRVIEALRGCPELARTPTVIGGKLAITGAGSGTPARQRALLTAGFDGVFEEGGSVLDFHAFVGSLPAGPRTVPTGSAARALPAGSGVLL